MARLLMELEVITSTLIQDADIAKIKLRFEEVANNYNVDRRTDEEMKNDFSDKINFYLFSLKLEGYSENTMYGNRIDLMAFGKFVDNAVVQVTTSDIRNYLSSNDKWANGTESDIFFDYFSQC